MTLVSCGQDSRLAGGVARVAGAGAAPWGGFALLAALSLGGCGTTEPIPPHGVVTDEAAYTALHPYYVEFCALSEIQKNPGYGADIRGGVGGHSTVYLNGVCRIEEEYPAIGLCDHDPGSNGVGLSVNAHFSNANWVAIPGRAFFYHGDLQPGQALTKTVYETTKAHAERLGIYDGIRFHDRVFDHMPPGYARDAFKYEVSISTDYAIGYGRDRYCARVPVSASQMLAMTGYLNELNRPYRDGRAEYEWSVLTDNCIHVAHNALTSIGFWPLWPTHRFILVAAFDFPVPKNEFVNIMRRANDMPIDDLLSVWDDVPARRAVLAGQGLPIRPGGLATFVPAVADNSLYRTDLRLIFYDEPTLGRYEGWYRRILADRRYTDLGENSRYFGTLYARIEADRRPLDWWLGHHPSVAREPAFPAFYRRFYNEVARQAAAISGSERPVAIAGS